jgi:acetyl-CoA carboxylase carboxyl transferase subunit alpha
LPISVHGKLLSWRHPQRPYTLDYVRLAFDEFDELAGDRAYDDKAIVGGIARLTVAR